MMTRIRKAMIEDSEELSRIAFSAKSYWNYPKEYMDRWKDELTIKPDYIQNNIVFVGENQSEIVGFYSMIIIAEDLRFGSILMEKGIWLDHMFINPALIRKGIGSLFIRHMKEYLSNNLYKKALIFVDPYAKGFYDKIGGRCVRNSDSSIPGRRIHVYEIDA